MPFRPSWAWTPLAIGKSEEVRALSGILNERLADLEGYLRQLHGENSFGPVPGAYMTLSLGADESPLATPLADGTLDVVTFPFEADVLMVQFYCLGGDVTVDIETSGSSILSAGSISLTAGTSTYLNDSGDFFASPAHVTTSLELIKDSTDSGNPYKIHARVFLKNVSRIEPT